MKQDNYNKIEEILRESGICKMFPELLSHILGASKIEEVVSFEPQNGTFEEIPLVDKYDDVTFMEDHITKDKFSLYLLKMADYILHTIQIVVNKRNPKFIGLTLCDPRTRWKINSCGQYS